VKQHQQELLVTKLLAWISALVDQLKPEYHTGPDENPV
jgi:hypothetical protein